MALRSKPKAEHTRDLGVRTWYLDDIERVVTTLRDGAATSGKLTITVGELDADEVDNLREASPRDLRNIKIDLTDPPVYVRLTRREGASARSGWRSDPQARTLVDQIADNAPRSRPGALVDGVGYALLAAGLSGAVLLLAALQIPVLGSLGAVLVAVAVVYSPFFVAYRVSHGSAKVVPRRRLEVRQERRATRGRFLDATYGAAVGAGLAALVGWLQ